MNKSIFRKNSIEKVSSPNQLNEYIRVVRPTAWIVLSAIIIFLLGVVIWGIFGTVETTIPAVAVCEGGKVVCYTNVENSDVPSIGMKVTFEEHTGTIKFVKDIPVQLDKPEEAYLLHKGGFKKDDFCYVAAVDAEKTPDGIYSAKITIDSVSPISFVLR